MTSCTPSTLEKIQRYPLLHSVPCCNATKRWQWRLMEYPSLIYTSHTANCNPNNPFQINLYFHPIHPIFHLLLGTSAKNAAQKHRNKKSQAEFFGAYVRYLSVWERTAGGVRTLQRAGSGVWAHVTSLVHHLYRSTVHSRLNYKENKWIS